MKTYKIQVMSMKDVDYAFEVLFAFGFVFTTVQRLKTYEEVKAQRNEMERSVWAWIINGYDNECQNVFGVSRAFDFTVSRYTRFQY